MRAASGTQSGTRSADRFRIAAESSEVGVFDHDHVTESVYWSPSFRRMLACHPRTRASLAQYLSRMHPDDGPVVSQAMERAHGAKSTGSLDVEHRLLLPDGHVRWLHLRSRTYFAGRGLRRRPARTIGVVVDITARKATESALRDSEAHYRRLFDQAYEFLGLLSLDGILLDANATALAFAGTARKQVIGKHFWDTPWWSGSPAAQRRLKKAIAQAAGGQFVRFETRHRNAKGDMEDVDFSLIPMLDETGKVFCLIPEGRLIPRREPHGASVMSATSEEPPAEGRMSWPGSRVANQALIRSILDTASEGILTIDERGVIASFNPAAEHMFGYAATEVRGRSVDMLMAAPDGERQDDSLRRRLSSGTSDLGGVGREVTGRRSNGSLFSMRLSVGEVRVGRHRVFSVMVQDLTLRRQTEEKLREVEDALRESNELTAEVFNSVNEGIVVYDRNMVCLLRNRFMAELSGIPNDEVVGHVLTQRFPELLAHGIDEALRRALAGETVITRHPLGWIKGTRHFLPPGSEDQPDDGRDVIWAWPAFHPRRSRSGDVVGVIAVIRDTTVRKRAEDAIKAEHARVRSLVLQLERAREEERHRLSRELHDEMGQLLTALRIDASWLHRKLGPDHAPLDQRAQSMIELIDQIKLSIRRIASELRPRALDEQGLLLALRGLTEEFSGRHGVECEFTAPSAEPPLSDEAVTQLYRATQEALTNVARHADATRVIVSLQTKAGIVTLDISDIGKGMAPGDRRKQKSFGLLGMQERVAGVGGTLSVESAAGRGTTVRIQIPLAEGV